MEGFDLIGPHDPRHTVLAAGLACFAQIEKDTRRAVDTMAHRIGFANQGK